MNNEELIAAGQERLEKGEQLELVRIVSSEGSTPRGDDAFMLMAADGYVGGTVGGGSVEYHAQEDAKVFLQNRQDGQKTYSLSRNAAADIGMICGGNVTVSFVWLNGDDGDGVLSSLAGELKKKKPFAWIFGGGHVSVCTAAELIRIGFDVAVYDDREEFANPERFPGAKQVIAAPYGEIASHVRIADGDYVVIMTRGHVCDYEVQKFALGTKAGYIGVIGSHAKLAGVSKKLLNDGFSPEQIGACYAPIGIQVGAETPEEIAVSIAAEMILIRARRENRRKVLEHGVIDYR